MNNCKLCKDLNKCICNHLEKHHKNVLKIIKKDVYGLIATPKHYNQLIDDINKYFKEEVIKNEA